MKRFDLSVYFVADPAVCKGRSVEAVVCSAVQGGATMIQLRDKDSSAKEVADRALALKEVLKGTGVALMINDHVDVAAYVGADGVHIGQEDLSPQRAREIMGPEAIIGLTAYMPEHFLALDPQIVDYAGTGPFFPTRTKPGKSVLGADGFCSLVKMSPVPVAGIGGITPDNAGEVIRAGAHGVAMMRAVSEANEPEKAAQDFVRAVSAARRKDVA